MYTLRNKYWPAYTWKIQTSYLKDFKGSLIKDSKISQEEFNERLSSIFDKINASFYHLEKLKENQEIALNLGQMLAKLKMPGMENLPGIAAAPYEPISYEYEAFLVTIKSSLDLITMLISVTFGRGEKDIISLIININRQQFSEKSPMSEIYIILQQKEFSNFIQEYKDPNKLENKRSKRNFATHHGSLPIGTTNVPINNPGASVLLVKPIDHNMPNPDFSSRNTPDLVEYCENHFYLMCDLYIKILSVLLNNEFKSGSKMSVYEQSKNLK